jgi:phosphoribosyl 1,2-cyclic phosphate phosphodiesterase
MEGRFLFLGTGGSLGVPVIGCRCAVCTSSFPYNQRLRTAGYIELNKKKILIDVGPDFRQQALKFHLDWIDGLIITHAHYDHIAGFDDFKVYHVITKRKVPCLLSKETYSEIEQRYHYLMDPFKVELDFQFFPSDFGKMTFEGIPLTYLTYYQSKMKVNGFRIGNFAYVTDIREYDPRVIEELQGVEILVLSALRHTATPAHFTIEEAIDFAEKIKAKNTVFTHIAHDLDHEKTNEELPKGFSLGYDGLALSFTVDEL